MTKQKNLLKAILNTYWFNKSKLFSNLYLWKQKINLYTAYSPSSAIPKNSLMLPKRLKSLDIRVTILMLLTLFTEWKRPWESKSHHWDGLFWGEASLDV